MPPKYYFISTEKREQRTVTFQLKHNILGQTRLSGGSVAPLLDHRLLHLPGVGPGPGAHLLGHVHTLLGGGQLGHQLGHVLAGPLGLQAALLLGGVLHDGLLLVVTLLLALGEPAAGGGTQLPGLLGAAGDGGVLLDLLLGDAAHLPGPLGALGVGGVAAGLVLALLLHLGPALHHVVLHVVHLLLGPALGLVLGAADLGTLHVAVLHQRGAAHLDGLVEGDLLVLDEASLPEVLITLLLLLRLVVGDVGGVAPLVVAVVALHHVVVLGLLDHLHLVDAPLAVVTGAGAGYVIEARGPAAVSLALGPRPEGLARHPLGSYRQVVVAPAVMAVISVPMVLTAPGVEGEGVDQGSLLPPALGAEEAGEADGEHQGLDRPHDECSTSGLQMEMLPRALPS